MAELDWRFEDAADLVRRDRKRVLAANSAWPLAALVLWLWLRTSAPVVAGVFLGMGLAWGLSLLSAWRAVARSWRSYVAAQFRPLQVELREDGLTWSGPHGSRVLRWDDLSVERLRATWVLRVSGRELAYLPARVLSPAEADRLRQQASPNRNVSIA
jgi:hypothetical protein